MAKRKNMRKILIISIILVFLFVIPFSSGSKIGSSSNSAINNKLNSSFISKSDEKPVIVEYFTQKNNPDSPVISNHLYDLFADLYPYHNQDCEFYYITFLTDVVDEANIRIQDYNIQNYPAVYFDGGFQEVHGKQSNEEPYNNAINNCKTKETSNVEIDISADWFQCPCQTNILTDIVITNNEDHDYNGKLIIYVAVIDSKWLDTNKRPFNYVFIGYIVNEEITIGTGWDKTYERHFDWCPNEIFSIKNADAYNILVVASLFSEETGFADDTSFDRLVPGEQPLKPNQPIGQIHPSIGNSYEYKTMSSDTDGNNIRYQWDWNGDYTYDEATDYFLSGAESNIFHIWEFPGKKIVRVKAKDENGLVSFWADPLTVSVPRYRKNINHENLDFPKFFHRSSMFAWLNNYFLNEKIKLSLNSGEYNG